MTTTEERVFKITVDYDRNVQDSIAAGNYYYTDPQITGENFPLKRGERGEKELCFTLYLLGRDISSNNAIGHMESKGKRPAVLLELLAFGQTEPEVQLQFPVVSLGSAWICQGLRRKIPYLHNFRGHCGIYLYWNDFTWHGTCSFLAVDK